MPGAKSSPKCQSCNICWQNALLIFPDPKATLNYIQLHRKSLPNNNLKKSPVVPNFPIFFWTGVLDEACFKQRLVHRLFIGVLHLSPPAEFGERRSDPKCGSQVSGRTGEGWRHVSDVTQKCLFWYGKSLKHRFLFPGSLTGLMEEISCTKVDLDSIHIRWAGFLYILTSIDLEKFVCQQYFLENTETHNADPLPFKVTWSFVDSSKLQWRMKAAWDQSTTMVCYLGLLHLATC